MYNKSCTRCGFRFQTFNASAVLCHSCWRGRPIKLLVMDDIDPDLTKLLALIDQGIPIVGMGDQLDTMRRHNEST